MYIYINIHASIMQYIYIYIYIYNHIYICIYIYIYTYVFSACHPFDKLTLLCSTESNLYTTGSQLVPHSSMSPRRAKKLDLKARVKPCRHIVVKETSDSKIHQEMIEFNIIFLQRSFCSPNIPKY